MANNVTAEIILRSADGSSILDVEGPITAENVAKYKVEKEVVDEVSSKLRESGFEVLQVGPTSITISGDKDLFERIFHTTLKDQSKDVISTKVEGTGVTYFEATEPIKVPEQLSSLIADVVLPTPPEFFP